MNQPTFIPKAPIYHFSMTHVWEECPTCKAYNKASKSEYSYISKSWYTIQFKECPECGQPFNWDAKALEDAAVYAKDYPRGQFWKGEEE